MNNTTLKAHSKQAYSNDSTRKDRQKNPSYHQALSSHSLPASHRTSRFMNDVNAAPYHSELSKLPQCPVFDARMSQNQKLRMQDSYLRALLSFSQKDRNNRVVAQEVERRVCDLASALVMQRSFVGGSVKQLSHLTNKLSKYDYLKPVQDAITEIANEVVTDLSKEISTVEYMLLFNAFAKFLQNSASVNAIVLLAEHLQNHPTAINRFQETKHLSSTLNALSKCSSDKACSRVASMLAQHLLSNQNLMDDLMPQGLANMLNAFSKWPSDKSCAAIGTMLSHYLLALEKSEGELTEAIQSHVKTSVAAMANVVYFGKIPVDCPDLGPLPHSVSQKFRKTDGIAIDNSNIGSIKPKSAQTAAAVERATIKEAQRLLEGVKQESKTLIATFQKMATTHGGHLVNLEHQIKSEASLI